MVWRANVISTTPILAGDPLFKKKGGADEVILISSVRGWIKITVL
jgi:hypothetical protein